MGHGHGHGPPSGESASASGRHASRLGVAFAILLVFFVLEAVVGYATSSLSLLSDAGHMLTDVLGIGMALAAITAARRSSEPQQERGSTKRTYGLYRVEVLAALANAVLLFGVAGYILYEAVERFQHPTEVAGTPMMITAALGLLANVVVFLFLRGGANESLNVRGAYLEVLADTVGSAGVLVAGLLTWAFDWYLADPIIAVGVGLFVLDRKSVV